MSELPKKFRKLSVNQRREVVENVYGLDDDELAFSGNSQQLLDLSEVMVESSVGVMPVPLGVVQDVTVDGETVDVPLAVEEPSVIAAATYASRIITGAGGFITSSTPPVMTAQVFLENVPPGTEHRIRDAHETIREHLDTLLVSLVRRGGGFRMLSVSRLESGVVKVEIGIDVRDAMGANILNTAAESLKSFLEEVSRGSAVMCILSNASFERRARAEFSLPTSSLPVRGTGKIAGLDAKKEAARKIVLASQIAREDENRAVTHNKGIMNGIHSLALATGNDTRAIEASAHAWASRDGTYRAMSSFQLEGDELKGVLELPLAFATVGGAVSSHPVSRMALKILGNPDSRKLSRIAAAVGLAQNFAALLALVTEGIQKGHMKLHAERVAFQAGARDSEVRIVAERIHSMGSISLETAERVLSELRSA